MKWVISHPLLFSMPIILCFFIHIFVSAGFILDRRKGFVRFSLYLISAWFLLGYLLLFHQWYNLCATSVSFFQQEAALIYKDNYHAVQVNIEDIDGIVFEGSEKYPKCIWLLSQSHMFYIDDNFSYIEKFLPTIKEAMEFDEQIIIGEGRYFITPSGAQTDGEKINYLIQKQNQYIKGNIEYYLIFLAIIPLLFYFLGQKAWNGIHHFFLLLVITYFVPVGLLTILLKTSLVVYAFLVIYFVYLLFLSAMCIKEK